MATKNGDCDEPETKKSKEQDALEDLGDFELVEVLQNNLERKFCALHAKKKLTEESAVIIMNKNPFAREALGAVLSPESTAVLHSQNDIYGNYDFFLSKQFSGTFL